MKVKITNVDTCAVYFSNGAKLSSYHDADCCEYNYADFEQLEEAALDTEFDWPLTFEETQNYGFRFGNRPNKMFFVPCYSFQNGYYSSDVDIELNGEVVLNVGCTIEYDY